MPRYFFNTENGEVVCDAGGEVLPDETAAKREAVKLMGAILRDRPDDFLERNRWRMLVADAERGDLFTVEVSMESGQAISDWGNDASRSSGSKKD